MKATHNIWIRKGLLHEPAKLDKQVFGVLSRQAGVLTREGFDIVIGGARLSASFQAFCKCPRKQGDEGSRGGKG
jgi:hypothetical protein